MQQGIAKKNGHQDGLRRGKTMHIVKFMEDHSRVYYSGFSTRSGRPGGVGRPSKNVEDTFPCESCIRQGSVEAPRSWLNNADLVEC